MSNQQTFIRVGTIPPVGEVAVETDDGTIISVGQAFKLNGGSGIVVSAEPNGSVNGIISLQNSFTDVGSTVGATDLDITTIPLPAEGTYTIEVRIAGYKTAGGTGNSGAGLSINGCVVSDGVTATLISDEDGFGHISSELNGVDANIIASGNNAIIRLTGVAGFSINWGAFSVYVFRGV